MTTGELNTKVQIQPYTVEQDENGDIDTTLGSAYSKWAKVDQSNGTLLFSNGIINFNEAYEITMRYETSRPTQVTHIINYKGKEMKIYNVKKEYEGCIWWEVVTAYTQN